MNVVKVFVHLELWVNVPVAIFFPTEDWRTVALMTVLANFLFPYYTKQIGSMLACVCSVTDHRRR